MAPRRKIAFAARGLSGPATGPQAYIRDFLPEFLRQNANYEIHVYYNDPAMLGSHPSAIEHVLPAGNPFLWDHLLLPPALARGRFDLAFFPKGTLPLWLPCPAVTIMLDLGYFYPELNAYRRADVLYMRPAMRLAARRAKAVFTISEHTRQDVIRLLGAPPAKVINILGAPGPFARVTDPATLEQIRRRYGLIEPFIFYPTNVSPRKNFPRLLDAFERVRERIPHHLYFTGRLAWNAEDVLQRLRGPLAERVHQLGEVPLSDMAGLYSLAQFCVYPSLFEGLGLPVLEAFRCGTPVLVSDRTSLPEVAGDAALTVDALSVDSIAAGLLRLAEDPALRAELSRRGLERAQLFTWERTVRRVSDWLQAYFGD